MAKTSLPQLNSLKHVHIVGVCGTLMGAFAAFLRRRNIRVTGSDQNVYPPMSDVLATAKVELFNGYRSENLSQFKTRPDLVVIGNVIRSDNPEARLAIDSGYAYTSLPEAMEALMLTLTRNRIVAGTHGKTTTSTLLSFVLAELGRKPNYFIGGVPVDLPYSFNVESIEKDHDFVLEGDEYDTAFWDKVPKFNHYLPDDVILTSVEFDHADIYADLDAVIRAFRGLVSRIRSGGRLIACLEYAPIRELVKEAKVPVITYGVGAKSGARFTLGQVKANRDGGIEFDVCENGSAVDHVALSVPGEHNALNALAVYILCRESGFDMKRVKAAMLRFQGVKRRQEVRGVVEGVTVIDDFAHHPTAVRETLRALKAKYSKSRLIAVFEPRSATSRRKIFQRDYAEAFDQADGIFISVPYDQSRIAVAEQFSSQELVADLKGRKRSAAVFDSVDVGVQQVADFVEPGDVVAVLSNGGFGGFIAKLLEQIPIAKKKAS